MKRFYIAILALAVASASCNKMVEIDSIAENLPEAEVADGRILCAIPQTKTALDGLNVVWSEEDEIMVFGEENRTAVYRFSSFASEDNKTTAIFENVDPSVKGNRSAIYPAAAYVEDSYNGTTAQISLGGVDDVTLSSGTPDQVLSKAMVSPLPLVSTPSEGTLSFANLFGGVMFRPYDYMGSGIQIRKIRISSTDGKALAGVATINLADGKITAFEGTETELTFTYNATSITSDKGFIAYIPAGTYEGLTITAIDVSDRKFPVTTGAVTVTAGVVKKLSQLPLTIYYGKANCYRVAPGTTSLDIDATPFYTYRSDYDVTKGQVIRCENGNMSGLGADVSVLWQQEEGSTATDLTGTASASKEADGAVVKGTLKIDRRYQEGKAIITVPLTGVKGNAVIALWAVNNENERTKIVWSYHIWVSDAADVTLGSDTYLDRNIGAVSTTQGDSDSYGVNYQWGRKDPFPRVLNATVTNHASQGDLLKTANKSVGGTIGYTISNPDTRITSTKSISHDNGDYWFKNAATKNIALWGCNAAYSSSSDAKTKGKNIKTVYDPCPSGYKVPSYGQLSNCCSGAVKATNGWTVNGNYFPYGGFIRLEESTAPATSGYMQGARGYLWSAISRSSTKEQGAYALKYNSINFNTETSNDGLSINRGNHIFSFMCDALPVRCIKE